MCFQNGWNVGIATIPICYQDVLLGSGSGYGFPRIIEMLIDLLYCHFLYYLDAYCKKVFSLHTVKIIFIHYGWRLIERWASNLKCILSHRGGRFMPAPSRLTIITVKNQKFFFDFLKLYNELGKVKFFQVSIIWFRGCNSSFSLGGALNAPPLWLIGLMYPWDAGKSGIEYPFSGKCISPLKFFPSLFFLSNLYCSEQNETFLLFLKLIYWIFSKIISTFRSTN